MRFARGPGAQRVNTDQNDVTTHVWHGCRRVTHVNCLDPPAACFVFVGSAQARAAVSGVVERYHIAVGPTEEKAAGAFLNARRFANRGEMGQRGRRGKTGGDGVTTALEHGSAAPDLGAGKVLGDKAMGFGDSINLGEVWREPLIGPHDPAAILRHRQKVRDCEPLQLVT